MVRSCLRRVIVGMRASRERVARESGIAVIGTVPFKMSRSATARNQPGPYPLQHARRGQEDQQRRA